MRWYVSYPILAAGLAFGADTLFPGEPSVARPLTEARAETAPPRVATPEILMASELADEPSLRLAAFSPGNALLAARPPQKTVLDYLAQALTPVASSSTIPDATAPVRVAAPAATPSVTGVTWTSAVIRDSDAVFNGAPQAVAPPDTPASRVALARDIQRELRRVGCYLGEIDGVWGRGSKRATLAFMDRVNASLPTQDPDVFVLSLLRAHNDAVCGSACPRGQSVTTGGRCLPTTIVAQADAAVSDTGSRDVSRIGAHARSTTLAPHHRMSIGGPKPDTFARLAVEPIGTEAPARVQPSLTRTAALETVSMDDDPTDPSQRARGRTIAGEPPAEGMAERRAKAARAKPARPAPTRTGSYRQVRHLFEHPLGRM